ncbi:MAG TPA: tetratricopeptide repeat protein [Pseudorhodoplanes sp.]|nr:tetratricopeptide repeat protein [Pseudorhodoplanes sp.]
MADIFNEVDEAVRRERLEKIWRQYGTYIIAVAVLIVAAVGGWRGYDYLQRQKAQEAGAQFEAAMTLAESGKHQEAADAFAKVAKEGAGGYTTLARLREAAELSARDVKAGVAAFDTLAADSSIGQRFQDLAALRAGFLLVDTAPLNEMTRRLEPLADPKRTFRHSARELLALSAWRANDMTAARRFAEQIIGDGETPGAIRSRIDVLIAMLPAAAKS